MVEILSRALGKARQFPNILLQKNTADPLTPVTLVGDASHTNDRPTHDRHPSSGPMRMTRP